MITLSSLKTTAKRLITEVYNVKFATIAQIKKLFPDKKLNQAFSWYEIVKICNEQLTKISTVMQAVKETAKTGYTINPLEYQEYQVINNQTKASYTVNLLANSFRERCDCMAANFNRECRHQKMVAEFVKKSLAKQIQENEKFEKIQEKTDKKVKEPQIIYEINQELLELRNRKEEASKELEKALKKFNCSFSEFDWFSVRVSTKVFYNRNKMGDVWYDGEKNAWYYEPTRNLTLKASCASDAVEMLLVRRGVKLAEALGVM
ncbi:hypothetical protein WA1_23995 [Scytonema hofmannii PCC 7110]|uniref:SWIM-type domain-containing protein n=1 Tax=Scytonema hofmannii PCC 7110 TaxID=128403 RepID=A0A139X7Q0_9CYAN|nr:hypothetical protein [Scytonema hofmannii]KYC40706.1 hypothetical protein WA1_23995 [Scytonema hofmannii PCC 7110]